MAVLRLELQGRSTSANCYDGIIETTDDLQDPMLEQADPGSLMYCAADKKAYLKLSNNSWDAVS